MQYETTLAQAISLLKAGRRITRSMAAQLIEEGYDLPSLVKFYSQK